MPGPTDEPVVGNVWGAPVELTEDELLGNFGEPEDSENDDSGDGDTDQLSSTDDSQDNPDESGESATDQVSVAEQINAWVTEQAKKFDAGDTDSVLYKPFQRSLSKKDEELKEARQLLQGQADQIASLVHDLNELGVGVNILSQAAIKNMAAEDVSDMEKNLLHAQLEANKKRQVAPPPVAAPATPVAQQAPPASDDIREVIAKANTEFIASRQAAARKAGIDPDKAQLEYGDPSMGVVARLDKFEASLEAAVKASKEAGLDKVRQKIPVPGTRSSSGTAPTLPTGRSLLQQGAAERTANARKAGHLA